MLSGSFLGGFSLVKHCWSFWRRVDDILRLMLDIGDLFFWRVLLNEFWCLVFDVSLMAIGGMFNGSVGE